jgi:hypothetical protein
MWQGEAVTESVHEDQMPLLWATLTNRAFFKQVTTSGGKVEEIWTLVAVAEACQLRGAVYVVGMADHGQSFVIFECLSY